VTKNNLNELSHEKIFTSLICGLQQLTRLTSLDIWKFNFHIES